MKQAEKYIIYCANNTDEWSVKTSYDDERGIAHEVGKEFDLTFASEDEAKEEYSERVSKLKSLVIEKVQENDSHYDSHDKFSVRMLFCGEVVEKTTMCEQDIAPFETVGDFEEFAVTTYRDETERTHFDMAFDEFAEKANDGTDCTLLGYIDKGSYPVPLLEYSDGIVYDFGYGIDLGGKEWQVEKM